MSGVVHSTDSTLKSTDTGTLDSSSVTEDVTSFGTDGENKLSSEELRRQKRLLRNRISAERSRKRRLSRIEELTAENESLKKELESLQAMEVENRRLKRQVELRESILQFSGAIRPDLESSAGYVKPNLVDVAYSTQQKFEQGSSWKNSVQDVAMLCNTEPQVEPCFQWSLGYEAPWLRHAFAARAALARQLCNKSTNDIR